MLATHHQRRARPTPHVVTLPRALRTLTRCLVCGFREVRTDEVIDRGILLLHECPRCDHRWTEHPLAPVMTAVGEVHALGAPAAA
jgi:hypothetical protein